MTSAQHAQHVYVTKFIRTFFKQGQSLYEDIVYMGHSSYSDKVYIYTRTKFIRDKEKNGGYPFMGGDIWGEVDTIWGIG